MRLRARRSPRFENMRESMVVHYFEEGKGAYSSGTQA